MVIPHELYSKTRVVLVIKVEDRRDFSSGNGRFEFDTYTLFIVKSHGHISVTLTQRTDIREIVH